MIDFHQFASGGVTANELIAPPAAGEVTASTALSADLTGGPRASRWVGPDLVNRRSQDNQAKSKLRNQANLAFEQKPEDYITLEPVVLGITKRAFLSESWVSSASFQEAKRVLMTSALDSKIDHLLGLKENIVVGRYIRAGTGFR